MEKKKARSPLATLSHRNLTLVYFCKERSSKNPLGLEDGESSQAGGLVKTSGLTQIEEEASYTVWPGVLENGDRQVSSNGTEEGLHSTSCLLDRLCCILMYLKVGPIECSINNSKGSMSSFICKE